MFRALPCLLLAACILLTPASTFAGVESHNQYRQQGPTRYVVSLLEVIHDAGVVKTQKRTYKWKSRSGSLNRHDWTPNETGVLPGEWYGPYRVNKSIDHLSWAGSYWRQDGANEANVYEVEVREERPVGLIEAASYPVEVSFRLVKRPPLFQPNLEN